MKWIGLAITSVGMGAGVAFLGYLAFPQLVSGRVVTVGVVAAAVIFLLNIGMHRPADETRRSEQV